MALPFQCPTDGPLVAPITCRTPSSVPLLTSLSQPPWPCSFTFPCAPVPQGFGTSVLSVYNTWPPCDSLPHLPEVLAQNGSPLGPTLTFTYLKSQLTPGAILFCFFPKHLTLLMCCMTFTCSLPVLPPPEWKLHGDRAFSVLFLAILPVPRKYLELDR